MKNSIFITMLFTIVSNSLLAQGEYKKVMTQNIHQLDTTSSPLPLQSLTASFGSLYEYSKDWHPLYYECFTLIKLSTLNIDASVKKTAIDKAGLLIQDLPEDNDEVQVLKAWYAMNYMGIDRSSWATFMPIFNGSIGKARQQNPENPRVDYLRGIMKFNMPASMGGGHEAGAQLFRDALVKFDHFKSSDEFAPAWGKDQTEEYLKLNEK